MHQVDTATRKNIEQDIVQSVPKTRTYAAPVLDRPIHTQYSHQPESDKQANDSSTAVVAYTTVGIGIASRIDPVYRTALGQAYRRRNHKYLGQAFVGAVQDVVVVCSPADCGTNPESGSGVCLIDRTADVGLLEGGMTFPKELRGLLSSLNYSSAPTRCWQLRTYDP